MDIPHPVPVHPLSSSAPAWRRTGGFTMVEILVTISIIILIVGLILAWIARAMIWSKERALMVSMGYLHNAVLRYNQTIPLPLAQKDANLYTVDVGNGPRPLTSMEYFLLRASELPACQEQIEKINSSYLVPVVRDGSGNPASFNIYITATGELYRSQYPLRTVKDYNRVELKFCGAAVATDPVTVPPFDEALPYSPYPYFAAAGRDRQWGRLTNHDVNLRDAQAKDNLYSNEEHQ